MKLYINEGINFLLAATGIVKNTPKANEGVMSNSIESTTASVASSIIQSPTKLISELKLCTEDNFLEWKDRFNRGGTGYIDGILPTDLDKPLHCGIDQWGRKYIAFKYTCTGEDGKSTLGAISIFQRYIGDDSLFVEGGHFTPKGCSSLGNLHPLGEFFIDTFPRFINGEAVDSYQYDFDGEKVLKKLELCNEKSCPTQLKLPAPESLNPNVLQLPSPSEAG